MIRTRRVMLMIEAKTNIPMKLLRDLVVWQATIDWAAAQPKTPNGCILHILQIQANVVKGKK